jgi:GNAT superfamily N-acetyltransferase
MSDALIIHDARESAIATSSPVLPLPEPGVALAFRRGNLDDLPFIDALQKKYGKELGFFPRAQMEGYLNNGWVLVACDASTGERVAYCASRDKYQKRDELGIVYQLCVSPDVQRRFVGAALLKEVFERSAYGCRLYCCWCAQDLCANHFWESMGFVPLAIRTGSRKKDRSHIFWQKRIRAGDTRTPWWFPSLTNGGSIGEDRLVMPIPPGVGWKDARALPAEKIDETPVARIETAAPKKTRAKKVEALPAPVKWRPAALSFAPVVEPVEPAKPAPKVKPKREKLKYDERHTTAARELRDRWLEEINNRPPALTTGKYDVARMIETNVRIEAVDVAPASNLLAA